ncbi:MAG: hypothetical protein QOD74_496 [Variibacter sp.]|nr:hypothetical protein [Variibacter sp.]
MTAPRWKRHGRIAQLVEQLTLNQRVQGSSPCAPTNLFKDLAGRRTRLDVLLTAEFDRKPTCAHSAPVDRIFRVEWRVVVRRANSSQLSGVSPDPVHSAQL